MRIIVFLLFLTVAVPAYGGICGMDSVLADSCDTIKPALPTFTDCDTTTGYCDLYSSDPSQYTLSDSSVIYSIPVVWHILYADSGNVDSTLIVDQMEILNQAYRAGAGSYAEGSTDVRIEFVLADEDEGGSPTSGINRIEHSTWFDSLMTSGAYCDTDSTVGDSLYWDASRYLNVVTHATVGDNRAFYPWFAADFPYFDAVRYDYHSVGDSVGSRILAHEIGHMFGLYHVEQKLCSPECDDDSTTSYTKGDMIFETENWPYGEFVFASCYAPKLACDSISTYPDDDNFMATGYEGCFEYFSPEQAGRMRCVLETYRDSLYLGIDESSIVATPTVFCQNGNDLFKLRVEWDTNLATDQAVLELYGPSKTCPTDPPTSSKTVTSTGTSHDVFVQINCPGDSTYSYVIKSIKGNRVSRVECRTVAVSDCPSCSQCPPPGCELE